MPHKRMRPPINIDFGDGKDHSAMMDIAFEDAGNDRYMKFAVCVSLYVVLAIIWMPGFGFGNRVFDADTKENIHQKRKVLKPPPEQPLERVKTKEKLAKKVPVPDLTPDDPEPHVEPDPPPDPDVLATDDWEIGIPDEPPPNTGDTIARVGQVGVEQPVFTKRVTPKYPERAVKIKLQGYVILEAILRKNGDIDGIKVLRPLGKGKFGFEDEAITALKKWVFLPGKVNGHPADVRMTLKIDFVLQ